MNYDIKELKYYKEKEYFDSQRINYRSEVTFKDETVMSRDEKIAFMNERFDNLYNRMATLAEKYNNALANGDIKIDQKRTLWFASDDNRESCGVPYISSLKKFYRKSSEEMGTDFPNTVLYNEDCVTKFSYGGRYFSLASWAYKYKEDETIDRLFHDALLILAEDERKYFVDHDEYTIILKKIMRHSAFGAFVSVPYDEDYAVVHGSNGISFGNFNTYRKATLEELKEFLETLDEIEAFINNKAKAFLKKTKEVEE